MERDNSEPTGSTGSDTISQTARQVVDPVVSSRKFALETSHLIENATAQRRRGIIVLDCQFPNIKIAFCAPQLKPSPIGFAVNIDYTNYDLEPLSVHFINPFSSELISFQELGHAFGRRITLANGQQQFQPLCLERHGLPFICLPGIREYHEHPDHSNDPWLSHRNRGGEGTLGFIVDKLWDYGILALNSFNTSIQLSMPQLQLGIDVTKIPS